MGSATPPKKSSGERVTRALKIGVTAGSEFLYQAHFLAPSIVSVGRKQDATIPLDHPDVPRCFELFSIEDESCLLQFQRDIDLAFFYDGLFRRPNYLIDEGLAFRRGRNYYLNLKSKARGTLAFGPYRLLFKLEVIAEPDAHAIPLPSVDNPTAHCGACGQPLELALARPGALSRCAVCRRFNRFGEQAAGSAEPAVPARTSAPDHTPILLDQPVDNPPHGMSTLEDRATVLDAGVIQELEASLGAKAPEQNASNETPEFAELEDRDTGWMSNNELITPEVQQAVNGDGHEPFAESDARPSASAPAPSAPASRPPSADPLVSGNIVPLPMTPSARRRVSALSSAPAHPVVRDKPDTGFSSNSYAAAKLADRLTLLIFALILIALLLACILGVLLVQSTMRSLSTAPATTADVGLFEPLELEDPPT